MKYTRKIFPARLLLAPFRSVLAGGGNVTVLPTANGISSLSARERNNELREIFMVVGGERTSMVRKWDYKTINPSESFAGIDMLSKDPESALEELGDDGWELVETIEESIGRTKYLIFKRPRTEETALD